MKIILTIAICLFSKLSNAQKGAKSSFIIPKGYQGFIIIIYDQPNNVKLPTTKQERIYKIPNNGILLTKSKNNFKPAYIEFYYTDSLNKVIKMEKLPSDGLYKHDTLIVMIEGGEFKFYESEQDKKPVEYTKFVISNNISDKKIKRRRQSIEFEKNGRRIKANIGY